MTDSPYFFGTVAQKLSDNVYSVISNWGQRVEATYYRTTLDGSEFGVGDHVFLERVGELWMLSSFAFGNPGSGSPSVGWFTVDHPIYGVVDGPGRIVP